MNTVFFNNHIKSTSTRAKRRATASVQTISTGVIVKIQESKIKASKSNYTKEI